MGPTSGVHHGCRRKRAPRRVPLTKMEPGLTAGAADAGPAGVRLPEVEAQDTGVTQGGGGANRSGYTGLSDGWGGEEMK